jgi:sphingolipid 4-desaturase/C4-monooxygenase
MGKGGNRINADTLNGDASKAPKSTNNSSKATQQTVRDDFYWSTEDEPHATRRKLILQKYPEIKQLYGHCTQLKYKVALSVFIQLSLAYYFRHQFDASEGTTHSKQPLFVFLLIAYVIGGTCNHMCMMGLHELSHNLGFKTLKYNQYYAVFVSNLPIGIPAAVSFKRYHMDHHKFQGVEGIDVDLPTAMEGHFFHTTLRKFFFVAFQMAFYAIRPLFVNPKPKTTIEIINIVYIIAVDALIVYFWGISSLLYLLISTYFGMGLHPCAGHFIAEHFVFPTEDGSVPETYSYYGVVNYFTFNVGYHNEHHDFPFIPGSRLPKVKEIAGEFYDVLPHHTSYIKVMYDYITMPSVSAFSRVKRTGTVEDPDGVITDQDEIQNKMKSSKNPIKSE